SFGRVDGRGYGAAEAGRWRQVRPSPYRGERRRGKRRGWRAGTPDRGHHDLLRGKGIWFPPSGFGRQGYLLPRFAAAGWGRDGTRAREADRLRAGDGPQRQNCREQPPVPDRRTATAASRGSSGEVVSLSSVRTPESCSKRHQEEDCPKIAHVQYYWTYRGRSIDRVSRHGRRNATIRLDCAGTQPGVLIRA